MSDAIATVAALRDHAATPACDRPALIGSAADLIEQLQARVAEQQGYATEASALRHRLHETKETATACFAGMRKAEAAREQALQCHGDVPCGACITCLNGKLDEAHARIRELEETVKLAGAGWARSRKFGAVCHCGTPLEDHERENHGAVEMRPECPNEARIRRIKCAVVSARNAFAYIWPDQTACSHIYAKIGFEALNDAEEKGA